MIKELIKEKYGLNVVSIERASAGAGADTYFADCTDRKYVIKFPETGEMNNPAAEPELCSYLLDKGINVCRFIENNEGNCISTDDNGRIFHVQEFIDGIMYDWNTAPSWLMRDAAGILGKIHSALNKYEGLPVGIGEAFFRFMTPENALRSYEKTVMTARENGDRDIEADLQYRIGLMKRFPKYEFDLNRLTCTGTHGDYFISQLICGEDRINAVIDWTTACIHPVVWEIMRSYVYAAPECAEGKLDMRCLAGYFSEYQKYSKLGLYDCEMAAKLFYYQIAVCDYYNQYYCSKAANRDIFLRQARFSTGLLKWFECNVNEVTQLLCK